MNHVIWLLVGVFAGIGSILLANVFWGFSAQSSADYASGAPRFDLRKQLGGNIVADGMVFDVRGRVSARFKAQMSGVFDEEGGTLAESFTYASGARDERKWTIAHDKGATFTATAPDIIGTAHGTISGNTVKMTYRIRLPERVGGHVLDAIDWMYLLDDGTILNRSEMRKFGIKVAELFVVMRKARETQ